MLARVLSLAAALLLAIASPQAHANARKPQSETARPARVSLEHYASAEIIDATPSRTWEICLVPLKCASTFGVTGYQKDSATGLYYAGARFYDPLIGGFNGMDPAFGDTNSPITLNKYLYANANPLIYIDPDGRAGFLTDWRNQFDDADEYFRLTAEQNPRFAQQIGMARGVVSLVGGGVRGVNLASDGVASLLDESYYGDVATQGRRELSETLDPAFRYAERYAANPVKTAMQTNLAVIAGIARTTVAAAGGDGGAISDVYSAATQAAVPALAARAGLVSAAGEVTAPARLIDDVVPDTSVKARVETVGESVSGTKVLALPPPKTATEWRNTPGRASGGVKAVDTDGSNWFAGSDGNMARMPRQVVERMVGRSFKSFDEFRSQFWRTVADTPELASQFGSRNIARMAEGNAPYAPVSQSVPGHKTYQLHHRTPISQGGPVFDFDNLLITTPRYHQEILDSGYHRGQ